MEGGIVGWDSWKVEREKLWVKRGKEGEYRRGSMGGEDLNYLNIVLIGYETLFVGARLPVLLIFFDNLL